MTINRDFTCDECGNEDVAFDTHLPAGWLERKRQSIDEDGAVCDERVTHFCNECAIKLMNKCGFNYVG